MTNTLYSLHNCPYSIRSRLAIIYSQQPVTLQEINLNNKPEVMKAANEKSVTALQLNDDSLLDESLYIMVWALEKNDPDCWLAPNLTKMLNLIDENDFDFKDNSDKYSEYIQQPKADYYKEQAEDFLFKLENKLINSPYLFGEKISLADIAIFPFIREFSLIDNTDFNNSPYPHLQKWLDTFNKSPLFHSVMKKN